MFKDHMIEVPFFGKKILSKVKHFLEHLDMWIHGLSNLASYKFDTYENIKPNVGTLRICYTGILCVTSF